MELTEDKDTAEESMDWQRFLMMGFLSKTVAGKVTEFYFEASRKRYEFIAGKISETLQENEIGLLFIQEGHAVQFPQDIEVFSIAPPALDEIRRWQREASAKQAPPEDKQA